MKINKLVTYAGIFLIAALITGCKGDNVVETENNTNNQNPGTPQLSEPVNNSTISSPDYTLRWSILEGTQTYRFQLSLDANFITNIFVDSVLSSNSLQIPAGIITTNVYYYWRVLSNLQGSSTGWSAVWRFNMILAPPPPPVLLLPLNNSVNQSFTPLFDWEDSPTAQHYRIQISQNQNFNPLVLETGELQFSEYQCPPFFLSSNTIYYWRVNASNSNGVSIGNWSSVFNIRTLDGPEPGSISGTIRFVDSVFASPPKYYLAAAYPVTSWPPGEQPPVRIDSLVIQRVNNEYISVYKIQNLIEGSYHIAVMMESGVFLSNLTSKGVYGCDTSRVIYSNCAFSSPGTITINSNAGIENVNILSWADSTINIFGN